MAATFAIIPAQKPEPLSATLRWRHMLVAAGLSWLLFGFLGYLRFVVGRNAPASYLEQFLEPKAALFGVLQTSLEALTSGLGVWAVLACFAPRVAILALPWIWGPCSGQWSMESLGTGDWHHVRYVLPMTALVLAAGLIGYARVASWFLNRRHGLVWVFLAFAIQAKLGAAGASGDESADGSDSNPDSSLAKPARSGRGLTRFEPTDGVLADHVVSAPLSSRRRLYGYLVDCEPAVRIPEARFRHPLDLCPERLLSPESVAGPRFSGRAPRRDADRRPSHLRRSKQKIRFSGISREHKTAIGCLYWVPLGGAFPRGRSTRRTGKRLPGIPGFSAWVHGRSGALPGRIDVSGAISEPMTR